MINSQIFERFLVGILLKGLSTEIVGGVEGRWFDLFVFCIV